MNSKFDKVRNYYIKGLWDEKRVKNAVAKGWITHEEYNEIMIAEDVAFNIRGEDN